MAFYIITIIIKIFLDDTTFIISDPTINECIIKFKSVVLILIEWCNFNSLDINWSKTYAMVTHNKPETITINNIQVNGEIAITIVDKFELSSVTIDNINLIS